MPVHPSETLPHIRVPHPDALGMQPQTFGVMALHF